MAAEIHELNRALEAFDRRNTPAGLLVRYARGRLRYFPSRQVLVLFGAVVLAYTVSLQIAALAVLVAAIGDVIDSYVLRGVTKKLERGETVKTLLRKTTLTAFAQAFGLSAFVAILWLATPREAALLLCLAYLGSASVNAIMALSYHRAAAFIRLSVYGASVFLLFVADFYMLQSHREQVFYNLVAALMVAYTMLPFVSYVTTGRQRDLRQQRRQIEQGLELAKANASLLARQREGRFLGSIAENAVDSIIMLDADANTLWVNPAFTRKTGYKLSEVVGKHPADYLHGPRSDPAILKRFTQAIKDGVAASGENVNYTKVGAPFWVETNLSPVFDENGKLEMVISVDRDVTLKNQRESELAEAKRAAEQGERAKTAFLATMSHEIRTPMNGIIGMSELLTDAKLSAEETLYVQTIRHSSEALLTIINDILDFSKLQDGHLKISSVAFELQPCLDEVMNLMRPQAASKGISLVIETTDNLPRTVWGDDGRLRQILVNVIGNAIKFTETGGVTVHVGTVKEGPDHGLEISVTDSGIGIAPDRIEHVFDQFAQADAATTRRFGGTGLGLAISRQLARMMGGDVTATSALNVGSCFVVHVDFPAVTLPAKRIEDPDVMPDPMVFAGTTVLLAEDNRTNRFLVQKLLKDLPLTLITAVNGKEAVEMVKTHKPQVVLMDMSMPEMDGLDATRFIRNHIPVQPHIIALTANAYRSDRQACLEAGMNGFLPKPVRRIDLLKAIAQGLESRTRVVQSR
ncbi:MAG: response regulator [Shimia sp.]|uniref:hybrid sensor histidine kinase/response regulator n=1 Tax=Shimia sp. TaxID=1954381 RepID=UPI003B8DFED2